MLHEPLSPHSPQPDHAPTDLFRELSPTDQVSMLLAMAPAERLAWMRLLPLDDAADLVQAAPDEERDGLLALLDDAARTEVAALMAYSEDVAGGLMNPRFMRLRPELTIDEAISYLRKQGPDVRLPIHYGYVLDPEQRLLGVLPPLALFSFPAEQTVRDVMNTHPVTVTDDTDQELVSQLFREHALGEVGPRDWWHVIRREFSVGLALGLLLALIGAMRILL